MVIYFCDKCGARLEQHSVIMLKHPNSYPNEAKLAAIFEDLSLEIQPKPYHERCITTTSHGWATGQIRIACGPLREENPLDFFIYNLSLRKKRVG
jgi:hypothetical protein